MSTTHYKPFQFSRDKFSFELKSPVEFIRPDWKVEEEFPFSLCEDYETERRRRMLGIAAFKMIEEEERQRRIEEIRSEDRIDRTKFSPSLVYTVIEEEMERQRRMEEIDEELYKERIRSRDITAKYEEKARAERIQDIFQEELEERKKSASVTRNLEEAERSRRIGDQAAQSKRKEFAASTSKKLMPGIKTVLRNKSLRSTKRGEEIKETELAEKLREERMRHSDKTKYLEEEERRRRMAEGEINMFKAKEMSKIIMKEVLENKLFKKISARR